MVKQRCGSCRFFQDASLAGSGWCHHPQRRTTSDLLIMVRRNELACRDEWAHSLWQPGNFGEAESATGGQAPDRRVPPATELEIAALVKTQGIADDYQDVVLAEARIVSDPGLRSSPRTSPGDEASTALRPSILDLDTRAAIKRARETYRERVRMLAKAAADGEAQEDLPRADVGGNGHQAPVGRAAPDPLPDHRTFDGERGAGASPGPPAEEILADPDEPFSDGGMQGLDHQTESTGTPFNDHTLDQDHDRDRDQQPSEPTGDAYPLSARPEPVPGARIQSGSTRGEADQPPVVNDVREAEADEALPLNGEPPFETAADRVPDDVRQKPPFADPRATIAAEAAAPASISVPSPVRRIETPWTVAKGQVGAWAATGKDSANGGGAGEPPSWFPDAEGDDGVKQEPLPGGNADAASWRDDGGRSPHPAAAEVSAWSTLDASLFGEAASVDGPTESEENGTEGDPSLATGNSMTAGHWTPLATVAAGVPRLCRTCRSFRPGDAGERGWCANRWAFTHRRLVEPEDPQPCESTVGSWWLPADDVCLAAADVSNHGQPTPHLDRWLPHHRGRPSERKQS